MVNLRREVDRALTVDWVPTRWVCFAVELDLQTIAGVRFVDGEADDLFRREPCCVAGRATDDLDVGDDSLFRANDDLWGAELRSVFAEADLPRESASRRWCMCPFDIEFLS